MEEEKQLVDFDSARRRFLSESAGAAGKTNDDQDDDNDN